MFDFPGRLTLILDLLCRAVALHVARLDRGPRTVWLGTRLFVETARLTPNGPIPLRPIARPIWLLLALRAARLARRFAVLVQRWRSGTLPRLRPARPRRPATAQDTLTPRTPAMRLPRERGWINRRLAEAAPCAGLLHAMLQAPEVKGFVAEVPRAGRLLRPMVHALGLDAPAWLRLPPRPRSSPGTRSRPREAAPAQPALGRPLEPYVRAAARAWNPDPVARRALKKFDA